MPDQNNTPDFEKMSLGEILKWMESLAHDHKRVGAEGLPGWNDLQNDEIPQNPDYYVPYGMTKEDWQKQVAAEAEQKRLRQQSLSEKKRRSSSS